MTELVKKLHIYSGVAFGLALFLFGVVGVYATFAGSPREAPPVQGLRRVVDYTVDPNFTDPQLARAVFDHLNIPHVAPVPDYALARNDAGELRLDFYGPNGRTRVWVQEKANKLEVIEERNDLGHYLINMHASLLLHAPRTFAVMLWSAYVELSIFALLGFVISGLYLWLATRRQLRWAQVTFVLGSVGSIAIMVWVA